MSENGYVFRATRPRIGLDHSIVMAGKWEGCPFWLADSTQASRPIVSKAILKWGEKGDRISPLNDRFAGRLVGKYRREAERVFNAPVDLSDPARQVTATAYVRIAFWGGRGTRVAPWPFALNADYSRFIESRFDCDGQWLSLPNGGFLYCRPSKAKRLPVLALAMGIRLEEFYKIAVAA